MTIEDRHQQLPHIGWRATGGATWSQCGAYALLRARLKAPAPAPSHGEWPNVTRSYENKQPELINTHIPFFFGQYYFGPSLPSGKSYFLDSKTNGKPMENQWIHSSSHTKFHESHFCFFAAYFLGDGYLLMDLDLLEGRFFS